ncbi:DUF928 domain-containing protein [Kamptonema formosum]|uniref:DUF928 domain-containing protein n=1 Tax=Kamptonema formosum TaxID=331992 RepID=UPI0004779453|nr:DUF928 domain-containing protein [Oscillatoria sp. PCC 10802]
MLRSNLPKKQVVFLTAALLLSGGSLLATAQADAVTFSAPQGTKGTPQQETTGGATRTGSQCEARTGASSEQGATALIPSSSVGLTVGERPTFFVFVPAMTAKEASFSLQDESENLLYQTKVPLPSGGGVVGVALPATAPALQVGKNYKWMLEVHCYAEFDPDNPLVEGLVRRTQINPALERKLEKATTNLERSAAYGEEGIWYEAVSALAAARQQQPQDSNLESNWEELLTSAGLKAIATQPLTR